MSDGYARHRYLTGWNCIAAALLALVVLAPGGARASAAQPGQSGSAPPAYAASANTSAARPAQKKAGSNGNCSAAQLLLNALNPFSNCQPLNQAAQAVLNTVTGLPGALAKAAATGIMDQVTAWMVQAAQTISGWVVKEAGLITKPELDASWYVSLFSGLAALGGALAGLVGLIALGSAAIRKDPDALGDVIYGIGRAGIGTSVVVALTIIALAAADAISNQFARQMPAEFYKTLASQWGGSGWGGFGAAALAFLVAFVATLAGLLVWLELIVREAAIYVAVLFFPVALAASIWPALRMWVRRLAMLLLMFVMLRPVVVIVLALAGSVTSAGLSFGHGSIPHSVGTILAGVVIFALAAFTPWALMFLLGTEVGVMYSRGTASSGTGAGRGLAGARDSGQVGGPLAGGQLGLAGGGTLAAASAGEGGGDHGSAGSGRGLRLASLGGSGAGAARAPAGPVAAAAGWMGGFAGAVGRAGGQAAQHAAARIQVAAGRSGVAPGGPLPASVLAPDGHEPTGGSREPDPFRAGGAPAADAPSPLDSAAPPPPPSPDQPPTSSAPPTGLDRPAPASPGNTVPPPPPAEGAGSGDRKPPSLGEAKDHPGGGG